MDTLQLIGSLLMVTVEYCGIPLPTELSYVLIAHLVAQGELSYLTAFSTLFIAHALGSTLAYNLGGQLSRFVRSSTASRKLQERLHRWYARYGALAVFGVQFIGHVRPWGALVAGLAGVPAATFYPYSLAGSALFTILMLSLAEVISIYWHAYPLLRFCVSLIFVGIVFLVVRELWQAHKTLPPRRRRRRAMDRSESVRVSTR